MSTKILKILTAMIIFTATLILNVYSVYAVEYTVSDLLGNTDPDLYCIQGGHHFFGKWDGEKDYTDRVPDGKDANGNTKYKTVTRQRDVNGLLLTGVFTKGAEHSLDSAPDKSEAEQKAAYVLAHGSGYYSKAQQYIWDNVSIMNKALVGSPVSAAAGKGSDTNLEDDASKYYRKNKKASIKQHNTNNPITTENYKVGPFAVSYDGTPDTVTVKGKDENGKIVTLSKNEYDIVQDGKTIKASEIKKREKILYY